MTNTQAKPVIFGCGATSLTQAEKDFFAKHQPFGFILFARNIDNPEQLKKLIGELNDSVMHKPEILVDQEGGRVQRLTTPHWPKHPATATYTTEKAAFDGAKQIAIELAEVGFTVNCAPMLDVRAPEAHDIIGDRAFSDDPKIVAKLGKAFAEGLVAGGVKPVIKHIPGHGRSTCDSHHDLPRVCASREQLEIDFFPFKALKDEPYAMTAHIIYEAIDAENCTTQSKAVIDLIRNDIGFTGLIMTDDLSMKALTGTFAERTRKSLEAGCDLILHCNGDMAEMIEIAEAI